MKLKIYIDFKTSDYRHASNHNFWQTFFNKGNMGEYNIYRSLEKVKGEKLLMTNLYIPKEDGSTTEIDLVMITKSGLFVVESKNYSGWIFGDERNFNWTQTFPNKQQFKFFNPIWQNKGHIKALKAVLALTEDSLVHSFIIFSSHCELKKITVTSSNVQVFQQNQLKRMLKRKQYNEPRLTSDEMQAYFQMLKPFMHADKKTKKLHIKRIQERLSLAKK
ncbi:nuclease-related domain-containing protein [Carnobacterium pleistocenium]|uniref:nuclease-related domain-containing protein n=1 Tax=Carnobacterium pleistocenium TaxID=181073 RepID=UPI001E42935F|nr:nuclease-related domain-containing protein [Carnobacterium pleistocenium]